MTRKLDNLGRQLVVHIEEVWSRRDLEERQRKQFEVTPNRRTRVEPRKKDSTNEKTEADRYEATEA